MEADPSRVDIDLDLDEPAGPERRSRPRRSWWVLAGLAALVIGLPGSAAAPPPRASAPASADPLPSARVTSGALREQDVPRLPPGDTSGDSSWCLVGRAEGGHTVVVPCGKPNPHYKANPH